MKKRQGRIGSLVLRTAVSGVFVWGLGGNGMRGGPDGKNSPLLAADALGGNDHISKSPNHQTSKSSPEVVAATVGGEPIYVRQVEQLLALAAHGHPPAGPTANRLRAAILAELVERQFVLRYLEQQHASAAPQDVELEFKRLKSEWDHGQGSWEQYLARGGQTETTLQAELNWKLSWTRYLKQQATDDVLKEFFTAHQAEFDGTELHVAHILLRPASAGDEAGVAALVKQAESIRADILAGKTTFEKAAAEYSAGPSRSRGGDLGYIPRHGLMDEAFARAAFALKKDELSQPVATVFGIHLIRVLDIKPGTKHWTDVRDELRSALAEQLFRRLSALSAGTFKVEFTGKSPYFKPGTTELVLPK